MDCLCGSTGGPLPLGILSSPRPIVLLDQHSLALSLAAIISPYSLADSILAFLSVHIASRTSNSSMVEDQPLRMIREAKLKSNWTTAFIGSASSSWWHGKASLTQSLIEEVIYRTFFVTATQPFACSLAVHSPSVVDSSRSDAR